MPQTAVDLVKRYYSSLAPGRRQSLIDILDPNFVLEFQEGFPGGRPRYKGIKEYVEDFLELIYGSMELEFVPEEYLECGQRTVVTGRMKGRGTSSGNSFDTPFAHLWTSNGRHLSHVRFFADTGILRDAIAGRSESSKSVKSSKKRG
jgi:ketosteroid isomerase-like protein